MTEEELYHFGIKGMKWGVRRYQNKDGSLTAAGKKRAAKQEAKDKQKRQEKFLADVNDPYKWSRSMNNASDKFNVKLKDINDRYKDDTFDDDFSTKRGQQYIKEVNALWKSIYADQLINDFGPEPINNGKEWVEHMPMMNQFAQWIKD